MYSETEDFKEKKVAYSAMMTVVRRYLDEKNLNLALEIGGSGGLLAGLLCNAGTRVICTDVVNVQVKYGGEFAKLLKEKFHRHDLNLDLGKIEFHEADAQSLLYGNDKFDFVFSLNALEHIPDPLRAIDEVWRVLRPGGVFYATFDPIWTADSGSHFMHYVKEPWLHLLLNENAFREKMRHGGAAEWEVNEYPNAMNQLPANFYMTKVKERLRSLFSESSMKEWRGCVSADDITHRNRIHAADKNGLNPEDLLIRGFQIVAMK